MTVRDIKTRATLVEQVAAYIEKKIKSGAWKVGDKLPPEAELVTMFKVGRNTVREAVKGLVHAGILDTRQGIGTIIKERDKLAVAVEREIRSNDLVETLEFRLYMEREAAMVAAVRRTDADLEEMRRCLQECIAMTDAADPQVFVDADIAFHESIARATHNSMLVGFYKHISNGLQKSINTLMDDRTPAAVERQVHHGLFEAIEAGDAPRAMEMVNVYLIEAIEAMRHLVGEPPE